jgi:hypothetical protein
MSENSILSADELLRLFLDAPSEAESAKFLDALVEIHALPVIEKVLQVKFGGKNNGSFSRQDYEDLCGECCVKIVGVLRGRKNAPDGAPIKDFSAYGAAIVYNVWNAFVRERSPNRESLKNKIRYSLDKDERFIAALEDGDGFYRLRKRDYEPPTKTIEQLTAAVKEKYGFSAQADLPDLLQLIFENAGGSLRVNELVKVVADLWQVRDFSAVSLDEFYRRAPAEIIRKDNFEMHGKLDYVWREIRALPVLQRMALLYNLRDENGGEMLYTFFNTRIAALGELAEAMNLTKAQFAVLLPLLPFDDKKIAAVMNLTIKQIGNLRKAARDNLRRRLDGRAKRKSAAAEKTEIYTFTGEDEDGAATAGEFLN